LAVGGVFVGSARRLTMVAALPIDLAEYKLWAIADVSARPSTLETHTN
jgi:hypothetical protein